MGTSGISECNGLVANTLQKHRWFFNTQIYIRKLADYPLSCQKPQKNSHFLTGKRLFLLAEISVPPILCKGHGQEITGRSPFGNNRNIIDTCPVKEQPHCIRPRNNILNTAVLFFCCCGNLSSYSCQLYTTGNCFRLIAAK